MGVILALDFAAIKAAAEAADAAAEQKRREAGAATSRSRPLLEQYEGKVIRLKGTVTKTNVKGATVMLKGVKAGNTIVADHVNVFPRDNGHLLLPKEGSVVEFEARPTRYKRADMTTSVGLSIIKVI